MKRFRKFLTEGTFRLTEALLSLVEKFNFHKHEGTRYSYQHNRTSIIDVYINDNNTACEVIFPKLDAPGHYEECSIYGPSTFKAIREEIAKIIELVNAHGYVWSDEDILRYNFIIDGNTISINTHNFSGAIDYIIRIFQDKDILIDKIYNDYLYVNNATTIEYLPRTINGTLFLNELPTTEDQWRALANIKYESLRLKNDQDEQTVKYKLDLIKAKEDNEFTDMFGDSLDNLI